MKIYSNFKNSVRGLRLTFFHPSFFLEIILGIPAIVLLIFIKGINTPVLLFILAYILLLAVELLNTSIELVCDRITKSHDEQIKNIKDIASGAVFLLVLMNIGLFVLNMVLI
jgi:diacylglycerol kinase (ATP)